MGHRGLVLTDDLEMGAIDRHYDMETVMDRVLAADIDLALICHRRAVVERAFDRLHARIETSSQVKSGAVRTVERIMRIKQRWLTAAADSAGF